MRDYFLPAFAGSPIREGGELNLKRKDQSMSDKELVDILNILRNDKSYLEKKFGLSSIGLFGSCVKGTQRPDSDIDLLVELREPTFDFLAGLQIYLEGRLGRSVEVIRKRKGLSERFLKRIEKEIYYV